MMHSQLAGLVALQPPISLLPDVRQAALVTRLDLKDCLALGDGRWLLVLRDQSARTWLTPSVVAGSSIRRARAGDGLNESLLNLMATSHDADSGIVWESWNLPIGMGEENIAADQTNRSVVVGNIAVVKWHSILSTSNPAPRILKALKAEGFESTPKLYGLLKWIDPENQTRDPFLLVTITEFLPESQDGWEWVVADLTNYLEGAIAFDESISPLMILGEIAARLHIDLAFLGMEDSQTDFSKDWISGAIQDLNSVLKEVDGDELEHVEARRHQIIRTLESVAGIDRTRLTTVHGDLHVGQFLRHRADGPTSASRYVVIDFDGNPVIDEAEKLARKPAAFDIASMLQSIDHVGRIVQRKRGGVADQRIEEWIAAAQKHFLTGYSGRLNQSGQANLLDERLLFAFRVRQELREFLYAERHLARWRFVADQALAALMDNESM